MKKKLTSLLVAAVLALSFGSMAACGGGTTSTTDKPNSSTSTPDQSSSSVPEVKKYTITVENGTGGGTFEENSKVTVKAEDKGEDYLFAGWKVGAEIVSTDKEYEVTVTADKTLVATYTYRYSVWDGRPKMRPRLMWWTKRPKPSPSTTRKRLRIGEAF